VQGVWLLDWTGCFSKATGSVNGWQAGLLDELVLFPTLCRFVVVLDRAGAIASCDVTRKNAFRRASVCIQIVFFIICWSMRIGIFLILLVKLCLHKWFVLTVTFWNCKIVSKLILHLSIFGSATDFLYPLILNLRFNCLFIPGMWASLAEPAIIAHPKLPLNWAAWQVTLEGSLESPKLLWSGATFRSRPGKN